MPFTYWSTERVAVLTAAIAAGKSNDVIAKEMGLTTRIIRNRRGNMARGDWRRAQRAGEGVAPLSPRSPPWVEADVAELMRLRDVMDLGFASIGKRLKRSDAACCTKYHLERRRAVREGANVVIAAAASQPDYRDLTAAFFGDPRPGRSALDLKRQSTAHLTPTGETHASYYRHPA